MTTMKESGTTGREPGTPAGTVRPGRDETSDDKDRTTSCTTDGRIPSAILDGQRRRLHMLRDAQTDGGLEAAQVRCRLYAPILAPWVARVRGQQTRSVMTMMCDGPTPMQECGETVVDGDEAAALARTAVALEEDLALRDAFLLAALTDLPLRRLREEMADPLGDPARTDVRETFGRGLRDARYRPTRYIVPACDALIEMSRRLPSPWGGQPLAMLSLLLWWRNQGDQALGEAALALSQRPGNALARLVVTAIDAGVFPQDDGTTSSTRSS